MTSALLHHLELQIGNTNLFADNVSVCDVFETKKLSVPSGRLSYLTLKSDLVVHFGG